MINIDICQCVLETLQALWEMKRTDTIKKHAEGPVTQGLLHVKGRISNTFNFLNKARKNAVWKENMTTT